MRHPRPAPDHLVVPAEERRARTPARSDPAARCRRESDRLLPDLAARYLSAVCAADGAEAELVVEQALAAGIRATSVQVSIIGAAMHEVGVRWERGLMSIADEHVATAIGQRVLVRVYDALSVEPPRTRERVVLAAVAGQHHTLGLRMVADVLEGDGFDVLYLGGDVPVEALRDFAADHEPAIVGLTCRFALGGAEFDASVEAVRTACPSARILVGGDRFPPRLEGSDLTWVSTSAGVLSAARSMTKPASRVHAPPVPRRGGQRPKPADALHGDTVESRLLAETEATGEAARRYVRQANAFRRLALEDPLTGLANRRAFDDAALALTACGGQAALLMLDVDRFKHVNDTEGHESGDRLLCSVADAIKATARPTDLVARIGGDEFVVLLVDCAAEDALRVAERMRARVAGSGEGVSLSVGVGSLRGDVRAALLEADTALYLAKADGRNAVRVAAGL